MSFLEKIKKIFSPEELKKEPVKINFEGLESKIKEIEEETKKELDSIHLKIRGDANELALELSEGIDRLVKINIEEKKENEKIKNIVRENLNLYISYLKKFTEDLKKIEVDENFLRKIATIFENFKTISKNSYEKATILIGELGETQQIIKKFSGSFNDLLIENKHIFEKRKNIESINDLMARRSVEIKSNEDLNSSLKDLQKRKEEFEDRKIEEEGNLDQIKRDEEYIKFLKEEEKKERENLEIGKEIVRIKKEIDLRILAKHFHPDKKASQLIQKYLEDFKEALEQDSNLEICRLIKESNENSNTAQIKSLRERIQKRKSEESDMEKKIREKNEQITKILNDIRYLENEILQEREKIKKIEEKIHEQKLEIKNKAVSLNIEII